MTVQNLNKLVLTLQPAEHLLLTGSFSIDGSVLVAEYRRFIGTPTSRKAELLNRWLRHACYEYGLLGTDSIVLDCAHVLWLAHSTSAILQAVGSENFLTPEETDADWAMAIRVALADRALFQSEPHYQNDSSRTDHARQIEAGRAARRLMDTGFTVTLADGTLGATSDERKKLDRAIQKRAADLGGLRVAESVLSLANQFYDERCDRYVIPKLVSNRPVTRSPSYPIGYLLDLALETLAEPECKDPATTDIKALFDTARDYIALFEVEPYSIGDFSCACLEDLLAMLPRLLAFDRWFDRRQMRPSLVCDLLRGCFDDSWSGAVQAPRERKLFKFEGFHIALETIITSSDGHRGPAIFGLFGLHEAIVSAGATSYEVPAILMALSHPPKHADQDDEETVYSINNAYENPFTRLGEQLHLADIRFFGEAAYHAASNAYALASNKPLREAYSDIGSRFERHVRDSFAKHSIALTSHFYGPKSSRSEIDGVLQTSKGVLLVEIKKHELSASGRSGDTIRAIRDFVITILKAQSQALRLEVMLLKGAVRLSGIGKVRIVDETIENVTIVPFSFGMLHYRRVGNDVLRLLPEILGSKELLGRLGQEVERLLETRRDLLAERKTLDPQRSGYFDFQFHILDYDQLHFLLERSTDAEAFYELLIRGSNADLSSLDWYKEQLTYSDYFDKFD